MNFISFLQTCFYVCLVCAILFFVISVVLFFVFDIKTIFNYKTGRAKAKTMKAMMETYDRTGRLYGDDKSLSEKLNPKKKRGSGKKKGKGKQNDTPVYNRYSVYEQQPAQQPAPAQPAPAPAPAVSAQPAPVQPVPTQPAANYAPQQGAYGQQPTQPSVPDSEGSEGTAVLYPSNPTQVLQQVRLQPYYNTDISTTEQLSSAPSAAVPSAPAANTYSGVDVHFSVVKKLVVVHTDEIIR